MDSKSNLFISPPFGSYLNLPKTIPIRGSYTLEPRPGLISQILKTFRYSFEKKGWINKIGLRNPGIDYAIKNYKKGTITSIAILDPKEVPIFEEKIPKDMDLELNVSCPNVDHVETKGLSIFLNDQREWCIMKLSPLISMKKIDEYYDSGFRQFHCSNTLPVENGGLSGPALIPYTSRLVKQIRKKYPDTVIIAGGGIRKWETVEQYKKLGANHVAVSTLCLSPISFLNVYLKHVSEISS